VAASRTMLEALLARVQKRASEPRPPSLPSAAREARAAVSPAPEPEYPLETVPPPTQDLDEADIEDDDVEDDIEEYDDELIEIIDDAEVIPQAAAAARAIEPAAFGASLDGRVGAGRVGAGHLGASHGARPVSTASMPAVNARSSPRPASVAPPGELRPESISPRAIAATEVARSEGVRRQMRVTSFVELLDASLKLGS
jgi:hypothetical protein